MRIKGHNFFLSGALLGWLMLIFALFGQQTLMAAQPGVINRFAHVAIPFVEHPAAETENGARFSVRTFWGAVKVSVAGDIYYALPGRQDQDGLRNLVFRESFAGKRDSSVNGEVKGSVPVHFFSGPKRALSETTPEVFDSVSLGEVYDGIHVSLKATGNSVEKIFRLAPGSDWRRIQVQVAGGQSLSLGEKGELLVKTADGPIVFSAPVAYQDTKAGRSFVRVSYNLLHSTETIYGFSVEAYDPTLELVIDPSLVAAFIGPTEEMMNYERPSTGLGLDAEGNVFVVGVTSSTNFPLTTGSFDGSFNGGDNDIFVVKLDKELKKILAATFVGGEGNEWCKAMLVDRQGFVFLAGSTSSASFPSTSGAFQAKHSGSRKSFVLKLDNSLSRLEASSIFAEGAAFAMAGSQEGGIYVGGVLYSGLPHEVSKNLEIFEKQYRGGETDGFIAKFNSNLSNLIGMTIVGGLGWDVIIDLVTDKNDNIYATGFTESADFPMTKGSYCTSHNDTPGPDAFVAKFDERLSKLLAATYIGGKGIDKAFGIVYDPLGANLFVTGRTESEDFPVFENSFNKKYNGGGSDAFIAKFDPDLKSLSASTFLGGAGIDQAFSLLHMPEQRSIIVVGDTDSKQFGGIPNSLPQDMSFPSTHAYYLVLNLDLANPRMSFWGGNGADRLPVAVVGADKSVYIAGHTTSKVFSNTHEERYRSTMPIDLFQGFVLQIYGIY